MYPRRKGFGTVVVLALVGSGITPLLKSGSGVSTMPVGTFTAPLAKPLPFKPVRLATGIKALPTTALFTMKFAG